LFTEFALIWVPTLSPVCGRWRINADTVLIFGWYHPRYSIPFATSHREVSLPGGATAISNTEVANRPFASIASPINGFLLQRLWLVIHEEVVVIVGSGFD